MIFQPPVCWRRREHPGLAKATMTDCSSVRRLRAPFDQSRTLDAATALFRSGLPFTAEMEVSGEEVHEGAYARR